MSWTRRCGNDWAQLGPPTDPGRTQLDQLAGEALLIAVHEGEHVRYLDGDEGITQCRALRDYGTVLNFVLGPARRFNFAQAQLRSLLWQGAWQMYGRMPARYHGATC